MSCKRNNYNMQFKSALTIISHRDNPPWTRTRVICNPRLNNPPNSPNPDYNTDKKNLQKNYKNQVLAKNNRNNNQLTKKQQYARLANGHSANGHRPITWASQTETHTNYNSNRHFKGPPGTFILRCETEPCVPCPPVIPVTPVTPPHHCPTTPGFPPIDCDLILLEELIQFNITLLLEEFLLEFYFTLPTLPFHPNPHA